MVPYAAAVLLCAGIFTWRSCAKRKGTGGDDTADAQRPLTIVICVAEADAQECAGNMNSVSSSLGSEDRVIIVADHVSEESLAMLKEKETSDPRFKVMENRGQRGKKHAQRMGVEEADTEAIVAIDADCRVGIHFAEAIREVISHCSHGNYMLLLPVEMKGDGDLFCSLMEMEFGCLQVVTAGTAMMGRPSMANGAGMAFSRTMFTEHDSKTEYASGDDMFLLEYAIKTGCVVRYVCDRRTLVSTSAPTSIAAYLRQRTRWLAKAGGFRSPNVITLAIIVFVAVMSWPAAVVCASAGWMTWWGVAAAFCAKLAVDATACGAWLCFRHGTRGLSKLWMAVPLEILYPVMTLTVTLRAIAAPRDRW